MAEQYTLARPYAKAIFAVAAEDHHLKEWRRLLEILAQIAQQSAVIKLIENPKLHREQVINIFYETVLSAVPELSSSIKHHLHNFVMLLYKEKRLQVLPAIATHFQKLFDAQENLTKMKILSAFPFNNSQQEMLRMKLRQKLNTQVSLEFIHAPELIGGVMIRGDDWILDGSVKGQIDRLRESLR